MEEKTRSVEKSTAKHQIFRLWQYLNQWSVNPSLENNHPPSPSRAALTTAIASAPPQPTQNLRQEKLWRYLTSQPDDAAGPSSSRDRQQTRQKLSLSELVAKDKKRSTPYAATSLPSLLPQHKATHQTEWLERAKKRLNSISSELSRDGQMLKTKSSSNSDIDISTQYFDDESGRSFSDMDLCDAECEDSGLEKASFSKRANRASRYPVSDVETDSD